MKYFIVHLYRRPTDAVSLWGRRFNVPLSVCQSQKNVQAIGWRAAIRRWADHVTTHALRRSRRSPVHFRHARACALWSWSRFRSAQLLSIVVENITLLGAAVLFKGRLHECHLTLSDTWCQTPSQKQTNKQTGIETNGQKPGIEFGAFLS